MTYGIGPDSDHIVYFRQLGPLYHIPPPKGSFFEGAELRPLASGGARYVGDPRVRWHWDFFKVAWYDVLRALCPGSSGTVLIRTTINDNEDEFHTFSAKYHWPLDLEKDSHRRMEFEVWFYEAVKLIVLITPQAAALSFTPQAMTVVPGMYTLATEAASLRFEPQPFTIDPGTPP